MSDAPPILVRGVLEKAPLAEFLVRALDEHLEGTLILQPPDGQKHAVLFLRGAPAKAKLADTPIYLGEVLVDLELVQRSVAVSTQKKAEATGKTHGQVLLDDGHLDPTGLYVALREQLARQMLHLCDLPPATAFGLYKANYLASYGPAPEWRVKPLPLVWRALVDHFPQERRDLALERLGGHMLRVRFESPVSRYHMERDELSLINMLRAKPQTLTELENCGVATPERVRKVVCALFVSRQLEGSARQGQPVGHSEPPESPNSTPPPSMRAARRSITAPRGPRTGFDAESGVPPALSQHPPSPSLAGGGIAGAAGSGAAGAGPSAGATGAPPGGVLHQAFREAILDWESSPPTNLYETLGVPPESDTAAIQRAFFQLARQWHPDKLPAELADLKPIVTRAFARMGEANHILTDPKRRAEYDEKLRTTPADEQGQVAAIIEASAAFQRAEVLMKKRDMQGALLEARAAYEGDPEQGDYLALYTWLRSVTGDGKPEEHIEKMSEALTRQPGNVRILWYRGQLYKKLGKDAAALRDFRALLEIKPGHVDAKREVRVFEMRRKTDPKPAGFLDRLLKK